VPHSRDVERKKNYSETAASLVATCMLPFKIAATAGLRRGLTYSTEYANSSRKSMQSNTRTALSGAHACAKAVDPAKLLLLNKRRLKHRIKSNPIYFKNGKHVSNEKKRSEETQTLRAGCSKAEPKIFAPSQTSFPGARDGQNLISWRWSLPSPTNPVW